ncbi:hypothetical protein [Microbacterium sp. 77mftsu3.1]|uniref:hypothetical protein n=1 Tax=Microbacterium sp. 77mftsu3.1 TaxID=1761802 RepID=UPI000373158C|nr:hypothetical protein [Microbacterium sp. 77mftsu3.1]SDG32535.1 hypothetical protein SAMN04488590_0607 [Microbacterium sp. 77mftsu3.1]
MTEQKNETPVAVWYFIGATFAGVAPSMFFSGVELWMRLLFLGIALALIVAGFVQLRREAGWGDKPTGEDPPSPPAPSNDA